MDFTLNFCEYNRSNSDYDRIFRPEGSGDFLFLLQSVPAPQNHCHLNFGLITQRRMLLTWCWFSGGEMTGKFRKVASHSAPEPAFGLFLNLPEGSAPWNPGTLMA